MDLSKLPKLSKTSEGQLAASVPAGEPAPVASPGGPPVNYYAPPVQSIGWAEAWISLALGVLILFIFPNTLRYIHAPAAFEQLYPVTDAQGNTIPYPKSVFFWADLGVTVFALALLLEGIALIAIRKVGPLLVAFAVTVLAAIFNVFVIVHVQPIMEFPIFCGVGVVVLGYMAFTQWRLIQALRPGKRVNG